MTRVELVIAVCGAAFCFYVMSRYAMPLLFDCVPGPDAIEMRLLGMWRFRIIRFEAIREVRVLRQRDLFRRDALILNAVFLSNRLWVPMVAVFPLRGEPWILTPSSADDFVLAVSNGLSTVAREH